ncbi:hypothetical protein C8R45DRAFT_1030920 [Mycena sanguinolenta]|nr:hypothetical protein C8R45DRAFT_1030920 [Mycena sanguinolenta]
MYRPQTQKLIGQGGVSHICSPRRFFPPPCRPPSCTDPAAPPPLRLAHPKTQCAQYTRTHRNRHLDVMCVMTRRSTMSSILPVCRHVTALAVSRPSSSARAPLVGGRSNGHRLQLTQPGRALDARSPVQSLQAQRGIARACRAPFPFTSPQRGCRSLALRFASYPLPPPCRQLSRTDPARLYTTGSGYIATSSFAPSVSTARPPAPPPGDEARDRDVAP